MVANPALLQCYAARIPALTSPRPLFAAVLFPVLTVPPAASYDGVIAEAEDYDDGFAKIVHGSQPQRADLLDTSPGGLPPSADFGLRLGWDDEQLTSWFNRQVDASQVDAPFGAGRLPGGRAEAWQRRLALPVRGDRPASARHRGARPVQRRAVRGDAPCQARPGPAGRVVAAGLFAHWRGASVVLPDPVARELPRRP